MAEWSPGDRTGRGVRCQFRQGFLKGLYPVCRDIMDVGPSAQTGISSSSCDFVSPNKGTRTRTVREYEQTINELKKENFDLKLRVFLLEESMSKISRKDEDCSPPDSTVEVIVKLKLESESLQNELSYKNKLLQESMDKAEKLYLEMKELEEKYTDLQGELVSLSELPSKEEYMHLFHEKENLLQKNESLEKKLQEINENFQEAQQRIEILARQNCLLEDKVHKRSLAIQGFVYKTYQEKEMLPDELRATVLQATQAARSGSVEELAMAIRNIKSILLQCLPEESLAQRVIPTLEEQIPANLSDIQSLKKVFPERNLLESFTQNSMLGRTATCSTNMSTANILACRDPSTLQKEIPTSLIPTSSVGESRPSVKNFSSTFSPTSVDQSSNLSIEDDFCSNTNSVLCELLLKEDVEIRGKVEENAAMRDFKIVCEENLPSVADVALCSANEFLFPRLKGTDEPTKNITKIIDLNVVSAENMPSAKNISNHANEFHFPLKENKILSTEICKNAITIKDLRTLCEEKISSIENAILFHTNEFDYQALLKENAELKNKQFKNGIQDFRIVCEEKIPSVENSIPFHANLFNYQTLLKENAELKEKIGKNSIQDLKIVCEEKIPSIENTISFHANEFDYQALLKENAELKEKTGKNSIQDLRIVCEEKFPSVKNIISTHPEEFHSQTLLKGKADLKEQICGNVIKDLKTVCDEEMSSVESVILSRAFEFQHHKHLVETENSKVKTKDNFIIKGRGMEMSFVEYGNSSLAEEFQPKECSKEEAELKEKVEENVLIKDVRIVSNQKTSSVENTQSGEFQFLKENKERVAVVEEMCKDASNDEEKRSELYERLAFSCSVNIELVRHLRTLEAFMEELLHNQLQDSKSLETSSFLSSLSKCLNESLKLSNVLSDHLSICEESQLFEECKGTSFSHEKSLHPVDVSGLNVPLIKSQQGFRHLFTKDTFVLDKYYFLVAEKFTKLQLLRREFENVEDDEACAGMDSVLASLDKTLHKLEVVRDHSPVICGRCVLHELLLDLEDSTNGMPSVSKSNIFLQFMEEIHLLREECHEPFCSFSTRIRGSAQPDVLSRNEENKICHLEQEIMDLNDKNERLTQNLDQVQNLLIKERKKLESLRTENVKLFSEVNDLKKEILNLKQKEEDLSLQNTELAEKLVCLGKENCKLNGILKVLENQKISSDSQLDQLIADLQKNKSELKNMSVRCLELEKELNEQTRLKDENVKRFINLQSTVSSDKEQYLTDVESLRSEKKYYVEELEILKEKLLSLEKENLLLNGKLNVKDNKLCSLVETVHSLQTAKDILDTTCSELQTALASAKERCQYLELKCNSQEEEASKKQTTCDDYHNQLLQLQTRFVAEKEKLLEQISVLTLEKDDVLQKLNCEKEHSNTLMMEMLKLNQKVIESGQQLTSLKLSNEQLESSQSNLLQKTHHMQNTLICSASDCESLRNNLKHAHETLLSLESKCSAYEKKIVASASVKDNIVECLLSFKKELSNTRFKVDEMCKSLGRDEYINLEWDVPEFMPVIDDDNVTRLCSLVTSEGKILFKTIDVLQEILKCYQTKLQKVDPGDMKITSREVELHKHEIAHLKAQIEHLEKILEENQTALSENEKSIKLSASKHQSLREKLQNSENETERSKLLLKMKEDEITMLQERVLNLQTYVNSMLVEKMGMQDDWKKVSNERLSLPTLLTTPEGELDLSSNFVSSNVSSPRKRSSCEKCHSLQKMLAVFRRRITILEEEKTDLKEFHNNMGLLDSTNATISELESKLEQKKSFINELKSELLKVCNSLIDKEREVDDLKMKLSEYKTKSHNLVEGVSKNILKEVGVNRKGLNNYKCKLIQSIYDLQRRFCEQKGIHLKYFDKFKSQGNNLYSLQLGQPLMKCVSLPQLGSHSFSPEWDLHWKDLELDIEYLENFKIFLSHFFIPSFVQSLKSSSKMPSTSSEQCEKLNDKWRPEETDQLKTKQGSFSELFCSDTLFIPPAALAPVKKYSSLETAASTISHHLDFMESFFNAVKEYKLSSNEDDSYKGCEAKSRSLLLMILSEIHSLHRGAKVLLSLNARMKKSGLLRPDISDGEESDKTMAVGCSETALYEEGRLSWDIEIASKPRLVNHSSCESIHHRSQYSSPDLGIESDPNHEPREDKVMQISFNSYKSSGTLLMGGDSLYAVGALPHYELLQREIQESLVGMRSILSRTGDGLHHIAARHSTTSPRKILEYSTLRAIKDTCSNVEACLKEAYRMVKKFRITPCPSEQEWTTLLQENQGLLEQLSKCKVLIQNQETEYKKAMEKLEHTQSLKANMEKKISKKLVKTKKVIRQAELKLLENGCQNCPPLPKYSFDSLPQQT